MSDPLPSPLNMHRFVYRLTLVLAALLASPSLTASQLHIGAATVDITPDQAVALAGQFHTRISKENATRIHAVGIALESRDGDQSLDHFVSLSVDLVAVRAGILDDLRERLAGKLEGLDLNKVFISATHTHTAPVTNLAHSYVLPESGIMTPPEYREFLLDRLAEVVTECWQKRQPGKFGFGQGQAVIAQNRRAVYADGSAAMYGKTNVENFRFIEGQENHNLDVLFFWDLEDRLIATAVNVPCPAQEVEGLSVVHADFWDPVRQQLRARHGENLHVLAWTGAAGDVVPRPMFDKKADERMRRLRGLTRLEEMARRIVQGWEEAYAAAKLEPIADPVLVHQVEPLELPLRAVTEAELAAAKAEMAKLEGNAAQQARYNWCKRVVDKHEAMSQGKAEPYRMELHALRLGDVAIATNPFELFTAYGAQMKARSPAVQSFIIQLAGPGTYLPTELAVQGGGYSAVIQSSNVGPEGGQVLVNATVSAWEKLWPDETPGEK